MTRSLNKYLQSFFSILYPWFPLWVWAFHFVTDKPITFFLNALTLPLCIYLQLSKPKKLPAYLIFYILFVLYHIYSTVSNNLVPPTQNIVVFILYDYNIFACTLFLIIEQVTFDDSFIKKMNNGIFYIIVISLIVILIQVKMPGFFYKEPVIMDDTPPIFTEMEDMRYASIYSWFEPNSGGITFPILVAIALNFFEAQKSRFILIILSGIVVSFLGKARYVMISTILAFSQLFFSRMKSFTKMASLILLFTAGILVIVFVAKQTGFDIQKVISSRVLEEDSDMESAKARIVSYDVFMLKFPEHPYLGVGPFTRKDVRALLGESIPLIHVGYLCYLYYYGIVGCFFLFLCLYFFLVDSWKVGRKTKFWGSFFGFLSYCLANATFVYFNFAEMGIVLAVIYVRYYRTLYMEEENYNKELAIL